MSVSFAFRFIGWFAFWGCLLAVPPSGAGWRCGVAGALAFLCTCVFLSAWLRLFTWLWFRVCLVAGWVLSLVGCVRGAALVLGWLPPSVPVLCRLRSLSPAAVALLSPRLRFWRWLALRCRVSSV